MERNQVETAFGLAEAALTARTIPELADTFLQALLAAEAAPAAMIYLGDDRLTGESFFERGFEPEGGKALREACRERFADIRRPADSGQETSVLESEGVPRIHLFALEGEQNRLGFLGLVGTEVVSPTSLLASSAAAVLSQAISRQLERLECEKQIRDLNTYFNVSTMVAQALDLREVLETVMYFCMEDLGAEAASVMLLDYQKENLRFYTAEGPAKPVITSTSFPADQGLAGAVLRNQTSEVVNDVQTDPRFFGRFDADADFVTRNMIALPLTAGEEAIGVLEVINKIEGEFSEGDLLHLESIAEEVAFAIRNATLFEVVVKSYCKQRQGLNSCKGCKRPLGSWTPCVKYREETGVLDI